MTHQSLVTESLSRPGGAYSQVTSMDGLEAQTEARLANVARALAVVGLDLSNVLKVTVHLADLHRDVAAFNETYAHTVSRPYPVRTTVGSQLLGILVGIDAVAGTPRQ